MTDPAPVPRFARTRAAAPGLAVAIAVAAVATVIGLFLPVVGGPVSAIVLGALVAAVIRPGDALQPGLLVASRPVLQAAIVVLGTGLSLRQIGQVGRESLPVMIGTLAIALAGAYLIGRALGVRGNTQVLIGVGTAICGASAIAASSAVIKAKDTEIAYSVGTIFAFNIVAVLLFPPLGHLLGLDPHPFGLWAGTAVNDTSSVVAAAYAYSAESGPYAVVVKLTRTLMLIPIVLVLALWTARRETGATDTGTATGATIGRRLPWRRLIPVFLLGFLLTATLRSVGAIPDSWVGPLQHIGTFLISTALAGIGLSMNLSAVRRAGVRPLILGGCLWVLVAVSSLLLQAVSGTL